MTVRIAVIYYGATGTVHALTGRRRELRLRRGRGTAAAARRRRHVDRPGLG
jgi:hypothetical protein